MKAALLFVALCLAYATAQTAIGHCVLRPTSAGQGISGTVVFTQNGNNVTVTANITGITANANALHGMHVHQWGDLLDTTPTAPSVGSHWVNSTQGHGCPELNGTARHLGDMGNWNVTAGTINFSKDLDLLALSGGLSIIGRAVVLHNRTDDCAVTGSAGERLAYCVIGIFNNTGNPARNDFTPEPTRAACDLVAIGTSGVSVSGRFYFTQNNPTGPTTVTGVVNGLDGLQHGVHVHSFGYLTSDGAGVGGHYNPGQNIHSLPPNSPRHVGDMGNIYFYDIAVSNTTAYYNYTNDQISLSGAENIIGRAVVVHAIQDRCDGTVLGARIAQCVIGIANTNGATNVTLAANTPTTQDASACALLTTTTTTGTSTDTGAASTVAPLLAMFVLAVIAALL